VDEDLDDLSREALIDEVRKLRAAIRAHRDSTLHELCWHHPDLWGLLPEKTDPQPVVPEWPRFMRGCVRYRQSLDDQLPDAPRSDAEFED
jgi:nicotinamidase-related amidase